MKNGRRSGRRRIAPVPCISMEGGFLPPMLSHAQNFEDVILRRALQDVQNGVYIDIGAFDPNTDSVTKWFYDQGWRGVNVEPVPAYHAKFERDRPQDTNLLAVVASHSGSVSIYLIDGTGLSTTSADYAKGAEASGFPSNGLIEVDSFSLDDLLARYAAGRTVDFLKIDVEGGEAAILVPASFREHRPRILVVEAVTPFEFKPAWDEWETALLSRDYLFAWFDGLNRFYVRKEDEWRLRFFQLPPCLLDNVENLNTYRYFGIVGRLSERESEIAEARATTLALEERASDADRKLAQAVAANDELQLRVGAIYAELAWHQSAYRELTAREALLTGEVSQSARQELQDRLSAVSSELAARDAEPQPIWHDREALARQTTEWRLRLVDVAAHLRESEAERVRLAQRLSERGLELAESHVASVALQHQRDDAEQRLAAAETELAQARERIQILERAHLTLVADLSAANDALAEAHSGMERAHAERALIAQALAERQQRVGELEQSWIRLNEELAEREQRLSAVACERDALFRQYEEMEAALQAALAQGSALDGDLRETRARAEQLERDRDTAARESNRLERLLEEESRAAIVRFEAVARHRDALAETAASQKDQIRMVTAELEAARSELLLASLQIDAERMRLRATRRLQDVTGKRPEENLH